jgi:DNA-directed RNA polymerase subunit alpha
MEKIALPQKIKFEKGDAEDQGLVVIEPCFPGFGITLGNSLRRVLLSSLPGAAVVGVKIKGADHEFMSLPHVKEDVLEIILNLKQLRFKLHSDEVVKMELEAHGEKEVKAKDFTKNSEAEIVNPDLSIAHITDMAGNLNIEIFVRKGRGYETIEARERTKHELGYIELDSPFSPVTSVSVNVENVRVGKMTNWDKLILNITTDGTIGVEEAFGKSTEILIEQFGALIGKEAAEPEATEEPASEAAEEKTETEEKTDDTKKKRGRPKKD